MERIYPGLCFIERVWLDVSYFSSFIAKLWHNYLEGINKGEEVIMRDTPSLVSDHRRRGYNTRRGNSNQYAKKNIHLEITSTRFRPFCFDGTQTFLWLFVFLKVKIRLHLFPYHWWYLIYLCIGPSYINPIKSLLMECKLHDEK